MSQPSTPRFDLIAFDIDGTLIDGPQGLTVWEVLNGRFTGNSSINRERYELYKQGRLSYADWVELDITGWQAAGATRAQLIDGFGDLSVIEGVPEALDQLKRSGARLIAVSGTLDLMLDSLLPDHPFEEVYANHIGFDNDGKISHWRATPFDMDGKGRLLRAVAMREGIRLNRCAFVGNSSNDVWIAREAGFTVAFNPVSDEFEAESDVVVRSEDFREVLPHLL